MTDATQVTAGDLTDHLDLGVLTAAIARVDIDEAIEATGTGAKRRGGSLPPHVMMYFTMALALYADRDYQQVMASMTDTLRRWGALPYVSWARGPSVEGAPSCLT